MKYEDFIIRNTQEFKHTQQLINETFNIHSNLPHQVFNKNYSYFFCEEYDWAIYHEFWPVLQKLANSSGDTHIITALLDPDPINFFLKNFGYYSWFKFPVTSTAEEYGHMMNYGPPQKPGETLLFMSKIVVWMPLSGKWAIWGQRAYGTCILAFLDKNLIQNVIPLPGMWRPASEALEDFICLNFANQQVPEQFASKFLLNYSAKQLVTKS